MERKTFLCLAIVIGFVLLASPVLPCDKAVFGPKEFKVGRFHFHSSFQSFKAGTPGDAILQISRANSNGRIHAGHVNLNGRFFSLSPILHAKNSTMQVPVNLRKRNYLWVFLYGQKGAAIKLKIKQAKQEQTNQAPIADNQNVELDEDTSASITLTGSDQDGDSLAFGIVSGPAHGTLSGTPPALTYTPPADYNGPDSFTFKVNDGKVDSPPATVNITVNAVNDAPRAAATSPGEARVGEEVSLDGSHSSDVDGDKLTYLWTLISYPAPVEPALANNTAPLTSFVPYLPGTYRVQLVVNDGTTDSPADTVTVSVAYPPFSLTEEKLMAGDGAAGARFGSSVSVDNNRAVIGAEGKGAAYIFESDSPWTETKQLNGEAADFFGASVAVSGDVAVVGAYGTDTSQDVWVRIFGEDKYAAPPGEDVFWVPASNEWGSNSNAFSILTAGDWPRNLMAKKLRLGFTGRQISLTVYDESGKILGSSSYTPGSELVLNPGSDIARIAVRGTLRIKNTEFLVSTGGPGAGAAYVFEHDGLQWGQSTKLTASDGKAGDAFGISVAVSDLVVLVGADMADGDVADSGAAYVFLRGESGWAEKAKLEGSEAGGRFGASVALNGDLAMVGAPGAEAAYLFVRNGDAWLPEAPLFAKDGAQGDIFGTSVAISGDIAVVGAPGADAAYVFSYDGEKWVQEAKLSSEKEDVLFGASVSISGDYVVVGAPEADGSGAMYVFKFDGSEWILEGKVAPKEATLGQDFGRSVSISGDVILSGAAGDNEKGDQAGADYAYRIDTYHTASISVEPAIIVAGASTEISWSWVNALVVQIEPGIGLADVGADPIGAGSAVVLPQADTTYTITAYGPYGKDVASVTVLVEP